MKVVIYSTANKGGMLHYTLHLAEAIQNIAENAILIIRKPDCELSSFKLENVRTFDFRDVIYPKFNPLRSVVNLLIDILTTAKISKDALLIC